MALEHLAQEHLGVARELFSQRRFDDARRHLEALVEAGCRYPDVFNMLGLAHYEDAQFTDAADAFSNALRINPNYTDASLNLTLTLNAMGRYEQADQICREAADRRAASKAETSSGEAQAIHVSGRIANMHSELADAYLEAGMDGEAAHELRKALLLRPGFSDIRLRLARLYRRNGQLETASLELQEAIHHRPRWAPLHAELGLVWHGLYQFDKAKDAFLHALDLEPKNRLARIGLETLDAN